MNVGFAPDLYREPLLFLGLAGVVVPLFRKIRISPVLGFLIAGMAVGPFALGRLANETGAPIPFMSQSERVAEIASFGVVFLMFNIGLELPFERLRSMRRFIFELGALQVAACAGVGFALFWTSGLSPGVALVFAAALSLSSTSIVVPVMAESRRLNTLSGRAAFSILLFQDLLVAPLLFMISMLAAHSDEGGVGFIWSFGWALAALALILALGRIVLRPLFQLVASAKSTELFMAACLLVVVGAAVSAAAAGLSMALGAFVAGLLLAETEYRREIEIAIEPFKGLLLGLFFVSVGAGLDPYQIVLHPAGTLGLALALVAIKAPLTALLARGFGLKPAQAREVGLLLGPGGEFAFIMIAQAVAGGLVAADLGARTMVGVTLSMCAIPGLAWAARKMQPRRVAPALAQAPEPASRDGAPARVIIIGYGRVGQLVGAMMRVHAIDFIAVDGDANTAARERGKGDPVYWGDATRLELLERCGLANARALVVTMHTPSAVDAVVTIARQARPDLTIVARARDANHASQLYRLGVTDAIPETMEASLQLSEAALVDIGVPMGLVIASIHEKRDEFRRLLQAAQPQTEKRPVRPFLARARGPGRKA